MKVLLLGDSHTVGPYGQALAKLFKDAGASVTVVANVGASAGNYLPGGKYASQVPSRVTNLLGFDIAIITLGTNDAAASDSVLPATSADRFKALANALPSSNVWYVGPPAFSDSAARTYNPIFAGPGKDLNTRAAAVLNEAFKRFGAKTIDARRATQPFVNAKDIHLGKQGGDAWARMVFEKTMAHKPQVPSSQDNALTTSKVTSSPLAWVVGGLLLWWAFGPRKKRP